MTAFAFKVVTSNVRGTPLMRQKHVVHDVDLVSKLADVMLWQEIGKARYKDAVRNLPDHFHTIGLHTEVPITFDKRVWEYVSHHVRLAHKGRATASPNRYIVWVYLRNRETGKIVCFLNTHFVSGAWNKKRKTFKKWRKRMWRHHYEVLNGIIRAILADKDITLVVGGDFNRADVQKFAENQIDLHDSGIDKLCLFPGKGILWKTAAGKVVPREHRNGRKRWVWTDHAARWANIHLRFLSNF